jgi:3-isopropylmalate/(R)-2-methylmalate dehydratase small subunit
VKIEKVSGRIVPIRGNDIDTDRIIPARFLKAVTFNGLEAHLFEDDRRQLKGASKLHPLDNPAYAGAGILVANANFGCGSSREHAPQAIMRSGIGAIIAESFAEIFFGNSMTIGLPCITASHDDVERVMAAVESRPAESFDVDIRALTLTGGGLRIALTMPASAQASLLSGDWDATGALLANYEEVERTAARIPYLGGFQDSRIQA